MNKNRWKLSIERSIIIGSCRGIQQFFFHHAFQSRTDHKSTLNHNVCISLHFLPGCTKPLLFSCTWYVNSQNHEKCTLGLKYHTRTLLLA